RSRGVWQIWRRRSTLRRRLFCAAAMIFIRHIVFTEFFWVALAFCTSVTAVLQEPPSYILGNALGFSSVAYRYVLRRTFLAFARIFVLADFRLEIIRWQKP